VYLSYAIARHVIGNEYTTMEIFALMHLIAGFLLCRRVCTIVGCSKFAAVVASLSFVLSGPVLVFGRAWHMFLPLAVWIPAVALCIESLRRGVPGWQWFCLTGACLAMPIHVGFPQLVVVFYGIFGGAVSALLLGRVVCWRKACQGVAALTLGVSLGAPILWAQYEFKSSARVQKQFDSSWNAKPGLLAFFLPSPLATAQPPFVLHQRPDFTHFYFFGGILAVCWVAGGFLAWGPRFAAWDSGPRLYWWMALVLLALSIGDEAALWRTLGMLPVVNTLVRHPIRVLPFFAFAAVVSGGFVFDRLWLRLCRFPSRQVIAAAAIFLLLGYHLTQVDTGVGYTMFKPYADVPCIDQLRSADCAAARRVCAFTSNFEDVPVWDPERTIGQSLGGHMASIHGIMALNLYDPVGESMLPFRRAKERLHLKAREAMRRYGVGWLITHETDALQAFGELDAETKKLAASSDRPWLSFTPWTGRLPIADFTALFSEIRDSEDRGIKCGNLRWFKLSHADAMAFSTRDPQAGLAFQVHTEGADVEVTNAAGRDVCINFLRLDDMTASIDGTDVACRSDDWGRILVSVPEGASRLSVRYRPKWAHGLWLALIVGIIAVGVFGFATFRLRRI